MRGIQVIYVSPTGATTESNDLVKDLENWFEDHRQMCRLMTAAMPQDGLEVRSSFERLNASLESGQRLFGRLKNSVEIQEPKRADLQSACSRIPLSGMNRFDERRPVTPVLPSSSASGSLQANVVTLSKPTVAEVPRMQPSRTYLKKNGNGT